MKKILNQNNLKMVNLKSITGLIVCYCESRDKGLIFGSNGLKYVFDSSCINGQIPKRKLIINQKCFVKFIPDSFYNNEVAKNIEYLKNVEKEISLPFHKEAIFAER